MIDWMLPGAVAVGVLGALYALARAWGLVGRFLPEVALVAVVILAIATGLAPLDGTRATMWAYAVWRTSMVGIVVLGFAWSGVRSPAKGPVSATEALLAGLALGAVPATAILAPRARDGAHAARIATLVTAASVASPVGGPAQVLLAGSAWVAWALIPGVALALVAWPWSERPTPPAWTLRDAAPGLLGIPFGWALGGMAGVGAYAAGVVIARYRGATPDGLSHGLPVRAALAAIFVAALLQMLGIPWGAAWMADLGDRVPVLAVAVASVAALPALVVEPFAAAAVAERVATLPSAPPDIARLILLPVALCPAPALAVAALTHGAATWKAGLAYALVGAGLAIGWVAIG